MELILPNLDDSGDTHLRYSGHQGCIYLKPTVNLKLLQRCPWARAPVR